MSGTAVRCASMPGIPGVPDGDDAAGAPVLARRAEAAFEQGRFAQAVDLAERAVAAARRCRDTPALGWSLMILGRAQARIGHLLQGYAAATEAYPLLGACGDVTRQLWALNTCAIAQIGCGDPARAIDLLRRGLVDASGAERSAVRCLLLYNLAELLRDNDEHAEGVACLAEAASLAEQWPQRAGQGLAYASQLAHAHLHYADHLGQQGNTLQAEHHRAEAERVLPALDPGRWPSFSMLEFASLRAQIEVLAGLQRWPAARAAAAAGLRLARRPGTGSRVRAEALVATAALHRRARDWRRSSRQELRAVAAWRATGDGRQLTISLRRLSQLHARCGAYDRALALRKELTAQQNSQHHEAGALRCRLAAIERQAERRRCQTKEAAMHAQRLAIVGRLIAQTHHALSAPIAQARDLAAQALACAAQPDVLRPLLAELGRIIDRAAGLVSQLRLFSYRSSPQLMALSLHKSLLDAWHGLQPHIGSRAADLRVEGRTQLQVWGDPQRLGIMLKVLLIELLQQACVGSATTMVIHARIDAGEADTVLLHIEAGGGTAPCAAPDPAPSLGVALCIEIAAEMQGELLPARDDAAGLRYRLQLPEPATRLGDLPIGLACPASAQPASS
jgi:C4-dicarboxylate-specific signal transduction histidine kinase